MPGKPPADFIAITDEMSTAQLERSLGPMREKAQSGDRIAQDIVGWTEDVLKERARTDNQPVIGADGHSYTQREYREKRERDNADAALGAMTGNFASAVVFKLTGDAHLAELAGGLFSAAGGTAKGYNENRQMSAPDPAPTSPPSGSPPRREVEPPSGSDESSSNGSGSGDGSGAGSAAAQNTGGGLDLEWITWADVLAFAEAVFGLPDDVVAAARELSAAGVPPSEATADFLSLFAAGVGSSSPPDAADEATGSTDGGAGGALPAQAPSTGLDDDSDFDMEREAAEAEADLEADVTPSTYDMRQDVSSGAGMPSPTGVTPASDDGSTSDDAGDLSYLDDGDAAGSEEGEGREDDPGDDEGELAYLDDDAEDPELSYLDGAGGAEDPGSPDGEAGVAEDAAGDGYDGGDSDGGDSGGEAVVVTGAA
jgi:hypothetical protein